MRIPTEHFRNVPVVLLSPSLMNSPCTSNTPSPSHHAHGGSGPHSLVDETFPRSLMERLLRPELERRVSAFCGSLQSQSCVAYLCFCIPVYVCPSDIPCSICVSMIVSNNPFPHHSRLATLSVALHHHQRTYARLPAHRAPACRVRPYRFRCHRNR